MLHCLGNGQELLSTSFVTAVCHDSNVFLMQLVISFVNDRNVFKVNVMATGPRVAHSI